MSSHAYLPFTNAGPKGYRLHQLELLNWGTFDGQIYTTRPHGESALLIGKNGTGKSTLVDALLTLLVRPGVRNFNVAAGAKKRERDEKSYLLGAFDRGSDEDGQGVRVKHLRPKGEQPAIILACFRNEDSGKAFTVAQLLYLASDHSVEKIYCFTDEERSIQQHLGGLTSSESLLKTLKKRGFRATKTFLEYEGWFQRKTRVKSKAMEVFNQTVAVKDIQKLNDFIRDHMLEAPDRGEKIDSLLSHFTQLSEAHDSLVKVRQQRDLLEPVVRIGGDYREQAEALETAERLQVATETYFAQRTVDLFVPAIEVKEQEREQLQRNQKLLALEIKEHQEQSRLLKNQMDQVGGDRLREIAQSMDLEQERRNRKQELSGSIQAALRNLAIATEISNENTFATMRSLLPSLAREHETQQDEIRQQRDESVLRRGEVRKRLTEMKSELAGLERRRENIPEWCVQLRHTLCNELGLAVRDLPFAAELMQVRADQGEWEPSIEKVLRGLALSLLVPDRYYSWVSSYVDRTRLAAQGRGQRLVYLRIADQTQDLRRTPPSLQSMIHKLEFREGQTLLPWLKAELSARYDYVCCDTVEEFQSTRGLAMTRNCHVKTGPLRHEKDDRDRSFDPNSFVLGWDNRDKKRRLAQEIQRLTEEDQSWTTRLECNEQVLSRLQSQLGSIQMVLKITRFDEIDFVFHEQEIKKLEQERKAIEEQSDTLQLLKQRLSESEARCSELQINKDRLIGDERSLRDQIDNARKILKKSKQELAKRHADGRFDIQQASFHEIDTELSGSPLTLENLFETEKNWRNRLEQRISRMRRMIDPIRDKLTEAMSKFLRVCPEESVDLRAAIDYLEGFIDLRQRIMEDDLPRHEQRFKERLNEKVIHEIAVFRNGLDQERREIESKIELLNDSLRKLEYRPGTHIQLQPRPIRDAEITDFQSRLRECIEGSFDDTPEANEARFTRIKELIVRMQADDTRRWRDKVTDVRRWFDFVAAVIDVNTHDVVSVYQDSSGQSGGEKAKLAFTILVAAIAYQYDLDPDHPVSDRFHFVVVDEMFSKVDDQHAEYALNLFRQFGLQLLIVAPLDAKARVTQPYVGYYLHIVKKENRSALYEMTAAEFDQYSVNEAVDQPVSGSI